jgi:hypothetical protein
MKRLSLVLILVLLVPMLIPCMAVNGQPSQIPHEDPSATQSTLDSYSFLSQYVEIFQLTASGQYENASQLTERLSHITVPEDLRYIIDRYSNLTQQLISVLLELDDTLNTASSLLDQYRIAEAGQSLDHAGVLVAKAQILLGDLQDATLTMSQRLGVFSSIVTSKVREAYNSLQGMLDRLQDLIDVYHQLLSRANQRVEGIKAEQLDSTALTLNLNATSGFVGGYLSASGVLTSDGSGLGNREVKVLLDGETVATTNTGANGAYHALIRVPYKYVDSVSIKALYTPQGKDKGAYLASVSPSIKVQVLFYRTMLSVSVPGVAYPGLSLSVNGNVISQDGLPLSGRQVKVILDGDVIGHITTEANGAFNVKALITSQAKLGINSLRVTVDSSGLYAGATSTRNITIQKMATTLEISAPSVIVLPSQLYLNGSVESASGPLRSANVEIEFANSSAIVKTLSDGSFNITIDVPFNTVFVGNQNLKVDVVPAESWQAVSQKTQSITVLNSVSIVVALACSFSIVFVMYYRSVGLRNKKGQKPVEIIKAFNLPTNDAGSKDISETAMPMMKFEGLKGRVLKAYVEALGSVQSVTGESLMPDMTLHEYLQVTISKIGNASGWFSDLTLLSEKCLYSAQAPNESEAEMAEKLAETIRRTMNGNA